LRVESVIELSSSVIESVKKQKKKREKNTKKKQKQKQTKIEKKTQKIEIFSTSSILSFFFQIGDY
jgi:hypothetical protein